MTKCAARLAPTVADFVLPSGEVMKYPKKRRCAPGEYAPRGILALYKRALARLSRVVGGLPHNAGCYCARDVGLSRRPRPDTEGVLESAGREAGWIDAVCREPEKYRFLTSIIRKGINGSRGVNSPTNWIDPVAAASLNPSPGRLQRILRAATRRANRILVAYGLRVSWRALGLATQRPCRRVGKVAHRLVRETLAQFAQNRRGPGYGMTSDSKDPRVTMQGLAQWRTASHKERESAEYLVGHGLIPSLQEALAYGVFSMNMLKRLKLWSSTGLPLTPQAVKWAENLPDHKWAWICREASDGRYASPEEALADADNALRQDRADGVVAYLDKDTSRTEDGEEYGKITVTRYVTYLDERAHRGFGTLCRSDTGRTYHWDTWVRDPSDAIARNAVAYWRRQDALERERLAKDETGKAARELAETGKNHRVTLMIRFEHSLRAGNCKDGTLAWMAEKGLAHAKLIPAPILVERYGGAARVDNTLLVAAKEVVQQMKERPSLNCQDKATVALS